MTKKGEQRIAELNLVIKCFLKLRRPTSGRVQLDPLVVVKKGEGEAALRNDQGVEIKRNASFIRVNNTANDKVATELWKIRERS